MHIIHYQWHDVLHVPTYYARKRKSKTHKDQTVILISTDPILDSGR